MERLLRYKCGDGDVGRSELVRDPSAAGDGANSNLKQTNGPPLHHCAACLPSTSVWGILPPGEV